MSTPRQELWDELERRLTGLLSTIGPKLGSQDSELIADFIDNREYGVACEWLTGAVRLGEVHLTQAEAAELKDLAERMHLPRLS